MILEGADQATARLEIVGCDAFRGRPVIHERHAVPPPHAVDLPRSHSVAHPVLPPGGLDDEIPAAIEVFGPGRPAERERSGLMRAIEDHQIIKMLPGTRRRRGHLLMRLWFLA